MLVFAPTDVTDPGLPARVADFAARGARVFAAADAPMAGATMLPVAAPVHPVVDAIGRIVSFYRLADELARARGHDPDRPPHLNKVTETR